MATAKMPQKEPVAKATSVIRNPLSAEAAPAAWGNGPTAPLWLMG